MTQTMGNLLVWLDESEPRLDLLGGKGASLARLAAFDAPVPRAVCLTTGAYREAMASLDLPDPTTVESDDDLARYRQAIEGMTLPNRLQAAVWAAYAALADRAGGDVALAVRSSATAEDSAAHSFAGLHDTILDVRDITSLETAVKRCWASLWTERAVAYRRDGGIVADAAIAVVIQQMIRTDVSLVAFTADPISGSHDRLVINATWGLGEALVSGMVTPDHIVVDRTSEVVEYVTGDKAAMVIPGEAGTRVVDVPRALRRLPALTAEQVGTVAKVARRLADLLGYAADIEAGFIGGDLVLFQARPITTLLPATVGAWLDAAA